MVHARLTVAPSRRFRTGPALNRRPPAYRHAADGPFPAGDLGRLPEEVAEFVSAGEQHPLGERIHLERQVVVARQVDDLCFEVDRQLGIRSLAHEVEQLPVPLRLDEDREQAVLEAIARKMSANEVDRMARIPHAVSAHGACSRDDPAPKL